MNQPKLKNETELLIAISEGDASAFRKLYDYYNPQLYSFSRKLSRSDQIAGELIQEIFTKVWINRHKLNTINSFEAWIKTIARNVLIDHLKKTAREKQKVLQFTRVITAVSNDTDHLVLDRENRHLLEKAIKSLTPQQKEVFVLSRNEGLQIIEISSRLNISINTAKKHLSNALYTLKHFINNHHHTILILLLQALNASILLFQGWN